MFENNAKAQAPARPGVRQRRGVERRRAILDAAEALLGEQGYQAGSLKAIGERAGIPTASVYHYFSDRHQVDAELLQRHVDELDALLTAALHSPALRTLRDAGDAVITPLRNYFRQHPSCTVLWFARGNQTLDELIRTFDTSQAERLWHFLIERELLPAETPQLVVQLAWEAGNRLFDTAFRRSPTGDDATIEEVRRLVTAYLETYAPRAAKRRG
ncbi:TetR/AcrR family transcriptional regulator [Streptomyces sp. NPDC090442]|uniref:TetR/AcrR family transcriptional regulator n=1 Tax=Streptomyces sp. NPDC090442 TaxID=3365962 RepID=UPI00380E1C2C